MTPDEHNRVGGTTYPRDVAPAGAEPLRERRPGLASRLLTALASFAVQRMRLEEGDILVVRGDVPRDVRKGIVQAVHNGEPGGSVAVFLPLDCAVHVERASLDQEDRGHRDTKNINRDSTTKLPRRGVFTGVTDARDPVSDSQSVDATRP